MNKLKREQFALGSFHYPRYSLNYFLDSAQRLGFQNVEIWGVAPWAYPEDLSAADCQRISRDIASRGLKHICYCPEQNTYPVNIGASLPGVRERSLQIMEKALKVCAATGSETFLLCPGSSSLDEDFEEGWKIRRESIERLVKTAEKEGVTMVIETQNYADCNTMHTVAEQRRILDEVNHPNFKAMIDVSQMTQFGDTIADNLRVLGDDLRHMHLTAAHSECLDLTLQGKALLEKYPHGRPMSTHMDFRGGNNPIVRYLKEMGAGGYSHYVTIEVCDRGCFLDPEPVAASALALALECLD
ncbi:MAG: sugar phosphate isomerase/epimerase [Oscillospiraceae bacterium]|nr:sugar phosphate isomerase/epimerase [Oscillospiraceae bacterium]